MSNSGETVALIQVEAYVYYDAQYLISTVRIIRVELLKRIQKRIFNKKGSQATQSYAGLP